MLFSLNRFFRGIKIMDFSYNIKTRPSGFITNKKHLQSSYKINNLRIMDNSRIFEEYPEQPQEKKQVNKTIQKNVKQFVESTSLHGLKYTADESISFFERIFFAVSFIIVLILSGYFISNVYERWKETPIIISTSPTPTYTSTIPFPAITICSLNQAKRSKVINIKPGSINHTLLQSLCAGDVDGKNVIQNIFGRWSIFRQFILDVSHSCDELLVFCRYGSKIESCEALFDPVLTDDGLCCTFNSVDPIYMFTRYNKEDSLDTDNETYGTHPVDWTPEKGYPAELPENFYPRIARGYGSHMGLTVVLNSSSSEYFCSTTKGLGFKILVHNPTEQPKIANYGFLIGSGRESRVTINPQLQVATDALKKIDKRIRHCLFSYEGNLSYYRTYTRKNCELECESRILEQECGCVLYYMPRPNEDALICGPKDNKCTKRVKMNIESSDNTNFTCEICYPACFELSYTQAMTTTTIYNSDFEVRDNYPKHIFENVEDISIIHFYYATNLFRKNTQDQLIGFTEFLSNTGGLLGLFMGFSIFSLIEILYFITLRPYCTVRSQKRLKNNEQTENFNKSNNIPNRNTAWLSPVKRTEDDNRKVLMKKILKGRKEKQNAVKKFPNSSVTEAVYPYCD